MKRITTALMAALLLAGCTGGDKADNNQVGSPSPTLQATATQPASQTPAETAVEETPATANIQPGETPAETQTYGPDLPAFDTLNLEAYKVDSSMLADKQLTMINFWATYCGPCINEMPDLGNLARSMPEGSQLWGVVIDAYDEPSILAARQIVEDAKADFPHLLLDEALYQFTSNIQVVPTTIFVDADGRQVGEPIEGAMGEQQYRDEIEQRLALL